MLTVVGLKRFMQMEGWDGSDVGEQSTRSGMVAILLSLFFFSKLIFSF